MNDLAEAAWRGTLTAYRGVCARPMRSFGAAGFVVATIAVVAGGRVVGLAASRPLTSWLGLAPAGAVGSSGVRPGAVLLGALVVLVVLWIGLVRTVDVRRQPLRRVWAVAAAWALPFVVGPPFAGTSIYSYVAYGRLVRVGQDPYSASPAGLGSSPIVAAIDPSARGDQSSAGPLGTVLQHLALSVSGGRLLGAVIVLRAVGVLAAFAIGRGAVVLVARSGAGATPGTSRATALALCVPNPLVLLYVVSSPHLEGVMVALVLAAAGAASRRAWATAVLLATLAGSVTATGFVALPLVVALHLVTRRRSRWWQALARDVAVAAATIAVTRLAVPDGFGWARTIRGQFDQRTPFAIADAVARLISPVVRGASYDDLAAGGQVTAAVAALCVVGYLVVTCRARTLDASIGFALLALALLAPVLHPWYLMWGVLVFAPTSTGMRRTWVLALTAAGCVLAPQGFGTAASHVITGVGLALIAIVTGPVLRSQDRQAQARADVGSAPTGDLAHRGADVGEVDAGDDGRGE